MAENTRNLLSPGHMLGSYRIEGVIGRGGMGDVYRATDTRLNRPVAIKLSATEFTDRFEREAKAISSLNHPNICTLYDIGPNYLVMEYVEGDTLAHVVKSGPMPLDTALTSAIQIADALSAAHAKNIYHRDLKPANIILTKNGIKVLDFGLAKFGESGAFSASGSSEIETRSKPITESGTILGTLHYMAPEQVEGKDTDARSDIFSFGSVLYEMLTGRRAFDGDSKTAILASVLKDQPAPIQQFQPQIPRALDRVVKRCLEKKPADRWQTAHDLKPTLELIDLGAPMSSTATASASLQTAAVSPKSRWLWPAIAAVAAVAVAGAAYTLWPGAKPAAHLTRFEVNLPSGATIVPGTFYIVASPDGSKLAFVTTGDKAGIWVRDVDAVDARLLAGTVGAVSPFWSPDSKSIAYGVASKLYRVDVAGGPPQVLCESKTAVGSGFWTENGQIVFGGRGTGPLQRVAASGGVPTVISKLAEGETFHSLPSLLPDQKHFLFYRAGKIVVGSLDSKPEEQGTKKVADALFGAVFVRSQNTSGGHLFFIRDRTLMAQPFDSSKLELTGEPVPVAQEIGVGTSHGHFSVTPGGMLAFRTGPGEKLELARISREGKSAESVLPAGTPITSFSLSPDESQIAVYRSSTAGVADGDIYVLDRARGIETRFTFNNGATMNNGPARPIWSPDGKYIAYQGKDKFWVKPSSGAGEPQPLLDIKSERISDWSRDGRSLLYYSYPAQTAQIFALPMNGPAKAGESSKLIAGGLGALSPDGRWLAYASMESGQPEVYVQPFRGSGSSASSTNAKWQISKAGGSHPRWRADGKELFFADDPGVSASAIEASGDVLHPSAPVRALSMTLARRTQWDVSRDGKFFYVVRSPDRGADNPITIVMNWEAGLKR